MAAPEQAQGIGKQVMDGLQWLGEKSIELASKGVQVAASGLGALIAMIPGMSALGEAVASAGVSRGGTESSRSESTVVAPSPSPAVATSQQQSSSVQAPSFPDNIANLAKAAAMPMVSLAGAYQVQNVSPEDIGGFILPANLPNIIGQSRGASMAIG
ncbi:MAG: hypothetical protein SFW63_03190 [Alphaproteobacteria bacterium]|nr:hypothetical protein [Alphaproteobacteria bacterium]